MGQVLVDTSVVISSALGKDKSVQHLLVNLHVSGEKLCLARQTIYEFWSVATRPSASNGFDQSAAEAHGEVQRLLAAYEVLLDPNDLLDRWLSLCLTHDVKGRPSHDARIAALMDAYGIDRVASMDKRGFSRFPHLTVLVP